MVNTLSKRLNNYIVFGNAATTTHPLCGGNQHACTTAQVRAITFCPRSFDYVSLASTKSSIKAGDTLDQQITIAQLWIHELSHLINRCEFRSSTEGLSLRANTAIQSETSQPSVDLVKQYLEMPTAG